MTCFRCEGRDKQCRDCGGTGEVKITCCPFDVLTPDIRDAIEASHDFTDFGIMPVGGGKLDQTRGWLESHKTYRRFVTELQAEQLKKARKHG